MVRAAGGADVAATLRPMCRWTAAGGTTARPTRQFSSLGDCESNRTNVHWRTISSWASGPACEAPQDVVLGHLERLQAEAVRHFDEDRDPRHDHRRSRGIEALDPLASSER